VVGTDEREVSPIERAAFRQAHVQNRQRNAALGGRVERVACIVNSEYSLENFAKVRYSCSEKLVPRLAIIRGWTT
jgi:hypothetical protein